MKPNTLLKVEYRNWKGTRTIELAANFPRAHQTRRQQHITASACINSAQAGHATSPSLGRISPAAPPCLWKSKGWLRAAGRLAIQPGRLTCYYLPYFRGY